MNIDKFGRTPIYEQIIGEIEKEILSGVLKPMDQLQSVRALSVEISINPNTIQKSYSELERLGVCYSAPGQGRFVSADAVEKIRSSKMSILTEINRLVGELLTVGMPFDEIMASISEYADRRKRGNSAK